MNITSEKLGNLDLRIKMEIVEDDYKERVARQLKEYQHKATVPGFRKGMAPMGLIQRMYKSSVVADEVQNLLGERLYKYIDDEKLELLGSPLSNDEMTPQPDFAHETSFVFYFDAALMPAVNIAWDKVDVKLAQVKVTAKDAEKQVDYLTRQYGKFESPETVEAGDYIYGKAVELDKQGQVKEGGVQSFVSFELPSVKDEEIRNSFVGKKAEEKVTFNVAKAFSTADVERMFRLDTAAAKKLKGDMELTISGCSRITPHALDEELFERVFPGEGVKTEEQFRKAVGRQIEQANAEQCEILFVNQVRKALLEQFDAELPEAFLKRWILSRSKDEKLTAEQLDADWAEKYLPGMKWELIDGALNKIERIDPSHEEVVSRIKELIGRNAGREEGEDDAAYEKRIGEAAESIARDGNNSRQVVDQLYLHKTFELLKKQLKPEVEKISAKEFEERAKA
ncbi:MAG: trigger factor [bacterium P3]|nr:MAG: trigger factor [bacterium P3]KWW38915.1 MAG: trigger factor [bacterium F083]